MKLILILMGGMFSMPGSGYDDSYEFTVKIEEEELGASVMAPGNEEMLIVGRHDNNTSEERFKLKAVTEFKPNNSGYVEQVNPVQRTYRWKCGGNVTMYDQEKQIAEFVTGEETWGQEFDIEVTATTMIVGKKKKQISADGKKKAIAPKIVLKSATFSETGGGSGFTILETFRGEPVSTPEYLRDDERGEEEKPPAGFLAGKKVCYVPEFEVAPSSLEKVTAWCEGNVLETEKKEFAVKEGKIKERVESKNTVEQKCYQGPEDAFADRDKWKFKVKEAELSLEEPLDISYYVLLEKGNGDKPWKNLLKAAFDTWEIGGAKSREQLVDKLSEGISKNDLYYNNFNAETGQTSSLYITQRRYPQSSSVSIGKMVDACAKGKKQARIICAEAAALLEYTGSVLAQAQINTRGVEWTEGKNIKNPVTGHEERKTWKEGHAYCLFGGLVQNPVPENGGPTNEEEQKYIDEELKAGYPERESFQEPRPITFEFIE